MAFAVAYKEEKARINAELKKTREQFWREYPSGTGLEQARQAYAQALFVKDIFNEGYEATDQMMGQQQYGGLFPSEVISSLRESRTGVEGLTGGRVEGTATIAKRNFHVWTMAMVARARQRSSWEDAFQATLPLYEKYAAQRDMAEYLFASPTSPLLRYTDPQTYAVAYILAAPRLISDVSQAHDLNVDDAKAKVAELVKKNGAEPFKQAVDVIRSYAKPEDLTLTGQGANSSAVFLLERVAGIKSGATKATPYNRNTEAFRQGVQASDQDLRPFLERYKETEAFDEIKRLWLVSLGDDVGSARQALEQADQLLARVSANAKNVTDMDRKLTMSMLKTFRFAVANNLDAVLGGRLYVGLPYPK